MHTDYMHHFLLISLAILGLGISSRFCVGIWLDYRAYKFVMKETDENIDLNSYDEIFYTKNHPSSLLNYFWSQIFKIVSGVLTLP